MVLCGIKANTTDLKNLGKNNMEIKPHDLAENIVSLADECSKLAERLDDLENLYCEWWQTFREEYKSDKAAEKAWDLTKEGQEMRTIKTKIKVKDRKIGAYKTYLRVLENEAKSQY
jgi:hypothetical protein